MFSQSLLTCVFYGPDWCSIALNIRKLVLFITMRNEQCRAQFQRFQDLYFSKNYYYKDNYITYYAFME